MATDNASLINQLATLTPAQEKLLDQGISFAPRLATALLILAVGYYLGVWVGRLLDKAVPNRKIVGEILHNYGEIRQLELKVGVAYDTDLGHAMAAVEAVLKANQRVLQEPLPVVQVAALADSSVTIGVRPWVKVPDYSAAIGELNRALLERLREIGINIPFPQREVRLLGADN